MNSKNREDDQQSKVMYCVRVFSLCVINFIGHYVTNSFNEGYGRQVYTAHGWSFDEEDNDGHQATSPIQMEFVNNYQNIDVVDFDVDNQVYFTLLIVYIKLYNLSLTYFFLQTCLKNTGWRYIEESSSNDKHFRTSIPKCK